MPLSQVAQVLIILVAQTACITLQHTLAFDTCAVDALLYILAGLTAAPMAEYDNY